MPDKNNHRTESLDNLFNAFSETIHPTKEELKKELVARGIDAESVLREGLPFIQKLQGRARIELAKKTMLAKIKAAKDAIKLLAPRLTVGNKEELARILFGEQAKVAVNFNKLNDLNDSDILDMLNEVQLLEFLEKLKK
jgi:hypothetical protein